MRTHHSLGLFCLLFAVGVFSVVAAPVEAPAPAAPAPEAKAGSALGSHPDPAPAPEVEPAAAKVEPPVASPRKPRKARAARAEAAPRVARTSAARLVAPDSARASEGALRPAQPASKKPRKGAGFVSSNPYQ